MKMPPGANLALAATLIGAGLLTGCSREPDGTASDGGGLCSVTIEFQGRTYTEYSTSAGSEDTIKIGRKLRTATRVDCPTEADGPDEVGPTADGPPPSPSTIHAIVGTPPSEAVYAERLGYMRAD